MIVSIVKACRDNLLYFANLEKNGPITGKIPLTPIVTEFDADYDVILMESNFLFILLSLDSYTNSLILNLIFSILPTLDQKWCSAPIKMHQITVLL